MRCDVYLAEHGFAKSRSAAKEMIEAGHVTVNGLVARKPSESIEEGAKVEILYQMPFVSRGGLKLDHALQSFGIDVAGVKALDIGASTGGFTDCLLKRGAIAVVAVDSGENQMDPALRVDARVICIEKYNARYMRPEDLAFVPSVVVMDVSFISQTLIIPAVASVLEDGGFFVSLIKPQFEVGRSAVGKKGIVKHGKDRLNAVRNVIACATENGLGCFGLTVSPIEGGDGNVEFLAAFRKGEPISVTPEKIKSVAEV